MSRLDNMKGGGFLNNVDGTFVDYELTHTFPGQVADPEQLFGTITVRPDGADKDVQTTLRFGSAKFLELVDSHTVRNIDGQPARIWEKSDGYNFLASIEKAGVPDGGLDPIDTDHLAFTSLIGRRMQFMQEKDVDRMNARMKAGHSPKRKDTKTGKEYDFTRLIVSKVYDTAPVTVATASEAPTKSAGRGRSTKAANVAAAKAGTGTPGPAGDGEAADVLDKILVDNGGAVLRSDLMRLATTELLQTKNPRREALRKRIYDAEFLKSNERVTFDEVGQTVERVGT